jgi:arginine exporter protein ArgO
MDSFPILVAGLTGFISGFLLSIPVGPINVTIINEGRRGLMWVLMIGAGAVVMEVLYCALAFTGFASFFQDGWLKTFMEFSSFLFMLYLGIRFLMVSRIPEMSKVEKRIEVKLKPHSAFMIGFVRVMGNLGVFLFWIVLATQFHTRGWVQQNWLSRMACVGGVGLGTGLWFSSLSYAVALGHKKFTQTTLIRMERFSGIGLILVALGHGAWILFQMARRGWTF